MPIGAFIGGLMREIRAHPFTTVAALISLSAVILMFPTYLKAEDIVQRVTNIEIAQKESLRESLENRLANLKSSLFDLKTQVEQIRAEGTIPDNLYKNEEKRLDSEIDKTNRELAFVIDEIDEMKQQNDE